MLELKDTLSYYKRRDVMKLILEQAQHKEIGVRYGDGFGKRPDILQYENDILEFAKKGCTSFHSSEESWDNPLQLNANLRKNELDELRSGWDLILDIDCPYWELSKIITYTFIKALKDHNISATTVKFSGSKGFHIAVPFEAFPISIARFDSIQGKTLQVNTKDWFPDGPRKIAEYLLYYIQQNLIKINSKTKTVQFGKVVHVSYEQFMKITEKKEEELFIHQCKKCKKILKEREIDESEYICPNCETTFRDHSRNVMLCPKCRKIMIQKSIVKTLCPCGSDEGEEVFDLRKIVDVDTVLISSRHLFRIAYSLHEKTGLVSMPFDIKHILKFEKEEAKPTAFNPHPYLDRRNAKSGEATELFQKAFEYSSEGLKRDRENVSKKFHDYKKEITTQGMPFVQDAIPEECFPPCIKKISAGLEDGKKRALFVLIKFLDNCNWTPEAIEEYIFAWNERCKPDQLKETYIRGQLRYHQSQRKNSSDPKDRSPAPNCDNRGYMIDTQFCNPDTLCRGIKNPIQYARKKSYLLNTGKITRARKRTGNDEAKDTSAQKPIRRKRELDAKGIAENLKTQGTVIDKGKSKDEFE